MTKMTTFNTKKCLICRRSNDTLHWHSSEESGIPWVYCIGTCQRAYSIYEYTAKAGISLSEFLKQKFEFKEALPNEVFRMDWPNSFISLLDDRAERGLQYIKSRHIQPDDGLYYDTMRDGIVFPYYYEDVFVGAQIRLIDPSKKEDGRKIDTLTGTRTGLLVYNWNQLPLLPHIRGVIVTEGAFDCKAIEQSIFKMYGGMLRCPWKCIATSGSGASRYQLDLVKGLKDSGLKVVVAPDSDKAGMGMFDKYLDAEAITHYAFTEDSKLDWNKALMDMGSDEFAAWFLGKVKSVRT